jgi:hypothetical protein
MSLYVYGVLDSAVVLNPEMRGIQGQTPRIIDDDDLRIIVSDFSGTSLVPTKENVFAHERIIESLMDQATPLPFRFGSVVYQEKLRQFVRSNRSLLQADLEQTRGCVEMGLKLMTGSSEIHPEERPATGTAYLQTRQKKQVLQKEAAAAVDAAVAGTIRRSDVSAVEGTSKPIIRIAHLVPRPLLEEYKVRIETLVRQRTDHHFLRSGPWPPYSFISAPYLR